MVVACPVRPSSLITIWASICSVSLTLVSQSECLLFRDLEYCDVQSPPMGDDDNDCGPDTQVDYAIAMTELCIIVKSIYRKSFGPMSRKYKRYEVLAEADKKLATWSLLPPNHLRLRPTLTLDLWPAMLHIVYDTVLLLLHRPRPQVSNPPSPSASPPSNDAEICSAATGVIQSIFESLCHRGQLSSVWVFGVTSLFTTMIHLNLEARFANPLSALAGVRRYDSTMYSMKALSEFWPSAESILHFFGHSDRLRCQRIEGEGDLRTPESNMDPLGGLTARVLATKAVQTSPDPEQEGLLPTYPASEREWQRPYSSLDTGDVPGRLGNTFLEYWTEMCWHEPLALGSKGILWTLQGRTRETCFRV